MSTTGICRSSVWWIWTNTGLGSLSQSPMAGQHPGPRPSPGMPRKQAESGNSSAYAGQWVARLQGRIVGQGDTPEEARRAALADRYKEVPEISYMQSPSFQLLSPLLDKVASLSP